MDGNMARLAARKEKRDHIPHMRRRRPMEACAEALKRVLESLNGCKTHTAALMVALPHAYVCTCGGERNARLTKS